MSFCHFPLAKRHFPLPCWQGEPNVPWIVVRHGLSSHLWSSSDHVRLSYNNFFISDEMTKLVTMLQSRYTENFRPPTHFEVDWTNNQGQVCLAEKLQWKTCTNLCSCPWNVVQGLPLNIYWSTLCGVVLLCIWTKPISVCSETAKLNSPKFDGDPTMLTESYRQTFCLFWQRLQIWHHRHRLIKTHKLNNFQ